MIVRDQGRFTVYWRGSGRVPFLRGRFDCPSCCLTRPRMAALSCFLVAIAQVFHSGLPHAAAASLSPPSALCSSAVLTPSPASSNRPLWPRGAAGFSASIDRRSASMRS